MVWQLRRPSGWHEERIFNLRQQLSRQLRATRARRRLVSARDDEVRIRPAGSGTAGGERVSLRASSARSCVPPARLDLRVQGSVVACRVEAAASGADGQRLRRSRFARPSVASSSRPASFASAAGVFARPRSPSISAICSATAVTRDGTDARLFDARGDTADVSAFAERCADDRHHFRFIVSPEDAPEMANLRAFIRDLMARASQDFGTPIDWVAVDHWNTDQPHVHVLARGVD